MKIIIMETIVIDISLIKETPNDMDLGALVREIYLNQIEDVEK